MAKITDCVTFNGEYALWDLRYNILKEYVDEFVVVEAPTTFSGKPKELYFKNVKDAYDKVKYFVIDENYTWAEIEQAYKSPNTQGAEHWMREFTQKESIKKALVHLNDEDIVFIGDCDEIYSKEALNAELNQKLRLRVYAYYLNNYSSEQFAGTFKGKWGDIKDKCLNHLRSGSKWSDKYYGWHFTSLKDGLRRKLTDSYTQETYANEWVMGNLDKNIAENRDFLNRQFIYKTDESEWPDYLKKNKEKYKSLCK